MDESVNYMYCPQCKTQLADDLAFCTNCGKQVRFLDEVETVVFPNVRKPRDLTAKILVAVVSGAVTFGIAAFLFSRPATNKVAHNSAPPVNSVSNIAVNNTAISAAQMEDTIRRQHADVAIQEQEQTNANAARRERQQRRNDRIAANAAANYPPPFYPANVNIRPINANPNVSYMPPPFDDNGKPLRAICKDGGPSYWQRDRWATCLTRGGVRVWFW